ncbi:DUF418 domain-containing protein [Streptomyces sp. NPDC002004]
MTHDLAVHVPATAAPTHSGSSAPSRVRLVGVDLARGLAVLGMLAAHIGPDPSTGGSVGWLMEVARGRSSALFALLAGFTLVLLTGRPQPYTGPARRQAAGRVLIRSVILVALGYALTALNTDVDVILAYYGLALVMALPLCRLRTAALAAVAAGAALVMPQVLYVLRAAIDGGSWADAIIAHDPLARLTDSDGVVGLLVTGDYPVLTWLPFIIAGMAVARLDLGRPGVPQRLALSGGALAVLGYGGSWLALHLVPGAVTAVNAAAHTRAGASAWWSDAVGDPVSTPQWLLVAAPHSQTTWSILGNTGVGLLVLAGCLIAVERSARLRRFARPVSAVGSVSLTVYVGHIVAIRTLGIGDLPDSAALPALIVLAAVAMLLASAWTRVFRRGPLEYMLYAATRPARLIG